MSGSGPAAEPGAVPAIAVVGRQNVGKSTLVNRLFGRRAAIAHPSPGVTRDRIELEASWRGRVFRLIDTGGFTASSRGIDALVTGQADRAIGEADVVLLVVDAQAGITEEDGRLARRLRRAEAPIVLVANKVDADRQEADVADLFALGLGEPVPVSALHGRGSGELLDRIVQLLPERGAAELPTSAEPRFALVGRPNVGKSSLFNRLVGDDRSVVFERAGTTRDSVDAMVTWPSGRVRFVDTAGMRRRTKVQGVEYYSFLRASEAIERADVGVLVIDGTDGFTTEDKRIAVRILEAGCGLQVVANKWDLVEERDRTFKRLRDDLGPFAAAGVLRTSALTGQGVYRLPPVLADLRERWARRVATARVNEMLQRAQRERPTARGVGTIHYGTQVSAGPPTFVLFGGREPDAGYRRFLENRLRREFDLAGVPIRLRFRERRRGGPRA
ncbi:MAG: ribosome biogenesis GTPase Der [Actinomycetota bacterium]